ncbi:peptidoglycan amidohydrolase family protein [Ruminococcus sp. NK3A76]|uniref:peptidoglycan amidohydrolase family protein n=1 Tax=Ruminococcus sp. NK3A76 TaxID=877411 RepID=UPI00068C3C36|nr:peptidoglycan amidohydrolase family protein [Ruminococcus sp. NK3A76]
MSKVSKAVEYMVKVANDPKHGYSQTNRNGNPDTWSDYDCSSLVISAYQAAGIPVKDKGATYTGNMYSVFLQCGFKDVTNKVNLATGSGLIAGDVLLNHQNHTAMMISTSQLAQASIDEKGGISGGKVGDQTGYEIATRSYYNYPWNVVLRYPETAAKALPVLDKSGYTLGKKTPGVLAYKEWLIYAKEKGYIKQGVKEDECFGEGTEKATNELLKKWGYKQTGIAGANLIKRLKKEIAKLK